jgi:hypothetical protein
MRTDAYQEGFDSRNSDCPYEWGTVEHADWQAGRNAAKAQKMWQELEEEKRVYGQKMWH